MIYMQNKTRIIRGTPRIKLENKPFKDLTTDEQKAFLRNRMPRMKKGGQQYKQVAMLRQQQTL